MKHYILYDASVEYMGDRILDSCEMTDAEATELNAKLRLTDSDARWIVYSSEPEDIYY